MTGFRHFLIFLNCVLFLQAVCADFNNIELTRQDEQGRLWATEDITVKISNFHLAEFLN